MSRRSAAYVLAIVSVIAFIVGALVLTVVDPVAQAVFASPSYSSTTSDGSDLLRWGRQVWSFMGAAMLLAILFTVWIETRQPT